MEVPDQVGWGLQQHDLVEGVRAQGRRVGKRILKIPFHPKPFHDSLILRMSVFQFRPGPKQKFRAL